MKKPNLLVWSDFCLAGTGFGTVSKYVVNALKDHFEIDQLAINYNGEFYDKEKLPIQVSPAKLLNPQDPYGNQMFVNALLTGKYDYVWIMNDTFVVEKVAKELEKVLANVEAKFKKRPKIIYYYPIDCQVVPGATTMLEIADHVVAYCEFGKAETLKRLPHIASKLSIINHGVDLKAFKKVDPAERQMFRETFLNTKDKNTFIWMNVNRNNARKDIAKTILAFSEFRKTVPNSKLYLHSAMKDTNIDLSINIEQLGLQLGKDVLFPANYGSHKPFPVEVLNALYNSCDGFVTTTYGEGWGLTHMDAMLVELPIVAPDNTCFPEQLAGGERGYLYPCKELVWMDNSGYRPMGRLEDIVSTMKECHQDIIDCNPMKVDRAFRYAQDLDWNVIGNQWVELFKLVSTSKPKKALGTMI